MRYPYVVLMVLSISISNVFAVEEKAPAATAEIKNLQAVLQNVRKKTDVPVLFPKVTGLSGGPYYAYAEAPAGDFTYIVYVDATEECHGAHYCNIGHVEAQVNGKLETEFLMDGKTEVKKTALKLANNITGYYTPGYALADYHPAKIQWEHKKVLYTIAGFNTENSQDFMEMANSAISGEVEKSKKSS